MEKQWLGLVEALELTLAKIPMMATEVLPVHECVQRVAAEDIYSKINSPSLTASLKDGYAIYSEDVAQASEEQPVVLPIIGTVSAGEKSPFSLQKGQAIRILTGAPLPEGAEAVVSQEFTKERGDEVIVMADSEPGRNVLVRGTDVAEGEQIVCRGDVLRAGHAGLIAAAGVDAVKVYKLPRVAIIATGDEILAPGEPFRSGALFASNLVTLSGFLRFRGIDVVMKVIKDQPDQIRETVSALLRECDALLTIGGAWEGDKDYSLGVLDELGWEPHYHRVRIGPGKAVAFGLLQNKPVFCLPGGPPSNEMAFLQIAFPAILAMSGYAPTPLAFAKAILQEEVGGQKSWTQFIYAELRNRDGNITVTPLVSKSRLKNMAGATAIIKIPEGERVLQKDSWIDVQLLV
ncbi:MAG: molybdopterin molybdotransferase MoeA [Syntrophaceae bacterium]|nr:molybdopterin molybdotransferase MoeA [Syntrophaceae bacterium]